MLNPRSGAGGPLAFSDHEDRALVLGEAHARPRPALAAPSAVSRIDLYVDGAGVRAHIEALQAHCEATNQPGPDTEARFHLFKLGEARAAFERHTEFVSYTFFVDRADGDAFVTTGLKAAGETWLAERPGRRLAAVHLHLLSSQDGALDKALCEEVFQRPDYAASHIRGGDASVASDFRPGEDGFVKMLVFDSTASDVARGRMVQRLLELETYRLGALLALPSARQSSETLDSLSAELDAMAERLAADPHVSRDRDILQRLMRLAGESERLSARTQYRFAAAAAYGGIVEERVERLREGRIEGHERLGVFIERRLNPAMRHYQSVSARQRALMERIDRSVRLLATRVEVSVEEQNAKLTKDMAQRTEAQLRIQETVEGLSAVAITYYAVSLIGYLAKGLQTSGLSPVPSEIVMAVAAPVLLLGTLVGVRGVRRWIERRQGRRGS